MEGKKKLFRQKLWDAMGSGLGKGTIYEPTITRQRLNIGETQGQTIARNRETIEDLNTDIKY